MKKLNNGNNDAHVHNLISQGTIIKGDIETDGDLRIDGNLIGNIIVKGKLVVGDSASIEGTIKCENADISGKIVEITLVQSDITVNKIMVPFDSRSPFQTSGLRVGTPAITTRGLKEKHMEPIVEMIDEVINNYEDEKVIIAVRDRVNKMMADFPIFDW